MGLLPGNFKDLEWEQKNKEGLSRLGVCTRCLSFFFYSGLSTATDHLLLYVSVATWLPPGLSVQCSDRRIEPGLSVKL